MNATLIKNAWIVNEGKIFPSDVLIKNSRIEKIASSISANQMDVLDAKGLHLFPGLIDDQVHFREPGLTHKGDIRSESRAAVAGGITSFMEMPNTVPAALTQKLLQDKYDIASRNSFANYSFFMGASNDNLEEVKRTNPKNICGVKIFMGSSTGNLLVDDEKALEGIFKYAPTIIATHCEDESSIRAMIEEYKRVKGDATTAQDHPLIRSAEACYLSSSHAVDLARKLGTRLHILHISTAKELELFSNKIPLKEKKITAEACLHHLWFNDSDYAEKGNLIKWNPAIKTKTDQDAILAAVLDGRIDVLATDHAPHTLEEKSKPYFDAPSGGPLVQHALVALLEMHKQGKISLEKIAEKTAHAPAELFQIENRGYIREGYQADFVLVDLKNPWTVNKSNLLYKCQWSPFEGQEFSSKVMYTFVNGNPVFAKGNFMQELKGERLIFDRV